MGLSVAISGGIILTVFMLILLSLPGFVDKMFSIGDITSQVTQHEQEISNTEIDAAHPSILIGSSKINFTLLNVGSEKLWNFEDYNLFIKYRGAISGNLTENLTFSGKCFGIVPSSGNWCIESITNDVMDPGIINTGEEATIWTNIKENLATNPYIISINTDNGVVDTISTSTCGAECDQIILNFSGDETTWAWTNKAAALQELLNTPRYQTQIDLTGFSQFRYVFYVATIGTAGSITGFQYSDDGGATWKGLDNNIAGSLSTATFSDNTIGLKIGVWTDLATGAQSDIRLRVAGSGGDGALDPAYGTMQIQFRS